jgi:putative phosphoesterase
MKLGIISDSHDNLPAVEAAVQRMREWKVEVILHAGDIVAPFVVPILAMSGAKVYAVYGNNDGERAGLRKKFKDIGELQGDVAVVDLDGKKAAVYHGSEPVIAEALIGCGRYDIVALGHSHTPLIERRGRTLVVNPGECCGYLRGKRTLALVDTDTMKADLIEF